MTVLLYPVFLEASTLTIDPFWKNIFEKLAEGQPPRGVSMSIEGILYHNAKKNKFSYYFKGKEASEIFNDLYLLFSQKLSLISTNEKDDQIKELNTIRDDIPDDWRSIRKKTVKHDFIINFVLNKGKEYDLSDEKQKSLYDYLESYFKLGIIKSDDITYSDGEILDISCVQFIKGDYTLNITINPIKEKKEKTEPEYMFNKWFKYIKI